MKKTVLIFMFIFSFLFLTGCLYPESEKIKNSGPVEVHIASVEDALKRYNKETGVYPILNSTINTPIYEKYQIDMSKLYPRFIGYLPPNSFENGGPHLYVMVNIEQSPSVRLIDLKTSSEVEKVQRLVNQYHFKKGSYPLGTHVAENFYTIDYQQLQIDTPEIISPFTDKLLPLLISQQGEVFVDYSLDIGIYMNQGYTFAGEDAREILVQNSYFVPVKSVAYQYVNGELKLVKNQ